MITFKKDKRNKLVKKIGALMAIAVMITAFPAYSFGAVSHNMVSGDVTFSGLNSKEVIRGVTFGDNYFSEDADNYNHNISKFSAALCAAAGGKSDANIQRTFADFGFANDETYDSKSYGRDYTVNKDVAGYSFASKDIRVEGQTFKLIVAVVRSTKDAEWYSNFNINDNGGGSKYHEGFFIAEKEIMESFKAYVQSLNVESEYTKVLVTGHSRGAAIANLMAGELSEQAEENGRSALVERQNVYGYTFAAPNAVAVAENDYSNIYNIVNPADFVANLPLEKWGYSKYGSEYALPCEKDANYNTLLAKASKEFNNITGLSYEPMSLNATTSFINNIYSLAPSVDDCYNRGIAYDGGDVTLKEYFNTLAGLLAEGRGFMSFLQYSNGDLSELTAYFAANQLMSSGIQDSHAVETYISWLEVTDAATLQNDVYTKIIAPKEFDFYSDCYGSSY